jgi:hypothetical protein
MSRIHQAARSALDTFRLRLRRLRGGQAYEIYPYFCKDGTFDYDRYKRVQTEGNKRKLGQVWVQEENIAFLSEYLRRVVGTVKFGICHGTRRGKEQEWFRKYLGGEVIGTEISETATQFPHTIQWDFHQTKPEWIDGVDFIYSNSFDHSYDPEKCLNAWMSCVRPRGLCILEHTSSCERATELDPFGAHIAQMPYLILLWAKGRYCVREIIPAPSRRAPVKGGETRYSYFLIIQRL